MWGAMKKPLPIDEWEEEEEKDDGIEVQRPGEEEKEEEEVGGEWDEGVEIFTDEEDGDSWEDYANGGENGDEGECAHCGQYNCGGEPDHGGDDEEEDDGGQWYYEEGKDEPHEEEEGEWLPLRKKFSQA